MNWDDKSDFEVNSKLDSLIWLNKSDVADAVICYKRKKIKVIAVSLLDFKVDIKDYCNSWADVGPLMLKFDVYILPTSNDCEFNYLAKTLIDGSIGMGWTTKYTSFNNNPLRAAATCLIKKLEAKNESIHTAG